MRYLLLLVSCLAMAQSTPEAAAAQFYDAVYNIDIDGVLNMSCLENNPENYGKLDGIFQSNDTKIRFSQTNATFKVVKTVESAGKTWSAIRYRNVIRVTYFKKLSTPDIAAHKVMLQSKYNPTSITYEPHRNAYLIVYPATLVAWMENDTWKVAVADQTFLSDLFDLCIPDEVRTALQL